MALAVLGLLLSSPLPARADDVRLVADGRPQAEIVVVDESPRTTRLAARELQHYVERISGAKLPVVAEPTGTAPVKVFIGRSRYTDERKIDAGDLKHGAYRIVSGDDWLALLGDDTEFTPIEPWPRSHGDWTSGRVHDEWHRITDSRWGNPLSQLRKHYTGRATTFGKPGHEAVADDGTPHVWGFDERGSFNAVCGFLRTLGVRWYMPGELGEVVPKTKTIALPKIDETVHPDFPVRSFNIRFGVHGDETARWAMRLGVRNPYGLQTAHGLHTMTHNEETLKNHPEWFALYGGKRHNQPGQRLNQLCYSNEELLAETVRFVKAQFDHYGFDVVSVMPPDGYTAICQCELCRGKDAPDRGYRGAFSDYVWKFVNDVAKEVRKTHPDKMISCCAYGTYTLPPRNIAKLEPNVQVIIVGGRRPRADRPEEREEIRALREGWVAKTDNPLVIFENYPFTDRGFYLPAYTIGVMGESINATKGISKGEDIWLSIGRNFPEEGIGFNHFLVYFTARMYWGGKDRDVRALFDEYLRLFYGPAAEPMRAFFDHCESNWREMEKDKARADRALELIARAKAAAEPGSVHARRIELIDDYLEGLRNKSRLLGQKRGPVPRLRLVGETRSEITVDGRLDDEAWQDCPVAATGSLSELHTGRRPTFETSFKTAWRGGDLYFAIRCDERAGEKLNVATTRDDDQAIWYGDVVEILLQTESHSYYQLAINPAGALVDLDRGAAKSGWFDWDSNAEVATHVADDHWTIEIRIPVVQDENDPLHQVIGSKPAQSLPWHVNVCRQRVREHGKELSAFAPTGEASFHVVSKFAHFYDGRSHQFEADPNVTDFLIAFRKTSDRIRKEPREALDAFVALAEGDEYQRTAALEQAALCARHLDDFDRAAELADAISIAAVADTVRMQNLLARRESEQLVERFGKADVAEWPFWKRGEASFARGRAFADTGRGAEAESDLTRALEFTSEPRERLAVLLELGSNRERNLKDNAAALEAYRRVADSTSNTGSAIYYRGVQNAARLLKEAGRLDEALAMLRRVEIDELRGYWRGSFLLALGETLAAADRRDEALGAYRQAAEAEGAGDAHRKAAREAVDALEHDSSP